MSLRVGRPADPVAGTEGWPGTQLVLAQRPHGNRGLRGGLLWAWIILTRGSLPSRGHTQFACSWHRSGSPQMGSPLLFVSHNVPSLLLWATEEGNRAGEERTQDPVAAPSSTRMGASQTHQSSECSFLKFFQHLLFHRSNLVRLILSTCSFLRWGN